MKFLSKGKDGGYESTVTGYWLIELKSLFSIVLLKFEGASREAYHTHAFNSISWLIKGKLHEMLYPSKDVYGYRPSLKPIITKRSTFHKVASTGTSWVISFRGPWSEYWREYREASGQIVRLSEGRVEDA